MDSFDKKILEILQHNNRITSDALGEKVGLSATACQRRIKKLRDSDVIAKEVMVLDGLALDNFVTIIVTIELKQGCNNGIDEFKKRMKNNKNVQQCYYVAGDSDFIVIITARNMLEYEKLTKALFFFDENIKKFQSNVVMDNVKLGLEIPV